MTIFGELLKIDHDLSFGNQKSKSCFVVATSPQSISWECESFSTHKNHKNHKKQQVVPSVNPTPQWKIADS